MWGNKILMFDLFTDGTPWRRLRLAPLILALACAGICPPSRAETSGSATDILKTEVCQECHGVNGNSISPYVPKLAGQSAIYMQKQLHDFQTGARKHPVMTVMAEGLDEARVTAITTYFAAAVKIKDEPPDTNSTGQRLFQGGDSVRGLPSCQSCHGESGEGKFNDDTVAPMIGGQRKAYLINQLLAWRNDDRKNSPGGVMNLLAKMLTASEIEKLAGYVSGL